MKALIVGLAALTGNIVFGSLAHAQEMVPVPDSIGGKPSDAAAAVPPGASLPPGPNGESWRYRQYEGRWWYWTPENRWMWHSDEGRWINFDANQPSAGNSARPSRRASPRGGGAVLDRLPSGRCGRRQAMGKCQRGCRPPCGRRRLRPARGRARGPDFCRLVTGRGLTARGMARQLSAGNSHLQLRAC